jgi:energy-coupling factor transporter ATP-binding protein EcfA2
MSQILKDLETWFKERPLWLQDASRRLFQYGEVSDKDINELVILCKREAGIPDGLEHLPEPQGIPDGLLHDVEESIEVRLISISDLKGINALNPRNPLKFGEEDITVIYGPNASGKSGYVRALKHACGARQPGRLYPNIFLDSPVGQSCKFVYQINGNACEVDWLVADGINMDLSAIQIYDSDCADVYISEENELTYEPGVLASFRDLAVICDQVCKSIDYEIALKTSTKPLLSEKLSNTQDGKWYKEISDQTTDEEINEKCQWTSEDEIEYRQIKRRLSEPDPKAKAKNLKTSKQHLCRILEVFGSLAYYLSPEKCAMYLEAQYDAHIKRKAATEDAKKVFENAPISGVGTESWRLFWEQARAYSEQEAYKGKPFPYTEEDARCILCQQELEIDARKRLESFENYIRGSLEREAEKAEDKLKGLKQQFDELPNIEDLNLLMDSSNIIDDHERNELLNFRDELGKRKQELLQAEYGEAFSELKGINTIRMLNYKAEILEKEARQYESDLAIEERNKLEQRALNYEVKKWLSDNQTAVVKEVNRLKEIRSLEQCKKLTSTKAISDKKSSLSNELITEALLERFRNELKKLHAEKIDVDIIKTRTEKGKVLHQIIIKNNKLGVPVSDVLSEGEFRIVSLAAFLADVEGHKNMSTFVFDDPISSLDQDFEEATAYRLIELSHSRQVIVFTHRLSLLASLQSAADKDGSALNVIGLQGPGEPREAPLPAQKPKKAINTLLERVVRARKVLTEHGQEEYEMIAIGICSDIRITLERLIENDLLADVIQRFRRPIITQGKLHKLAKITLDDCKYIDNLMTKYSQYEHSQPNEAPISIPGPDELGDDLQTLKSWRDEFEKRQIS